MTTAPPPPGGRRAYAGDVEPRRAYEELTENPDAVLVDCRTRAEWDYVGIPDLSGINRRLLLLEWQSYPEGTVDPEFVDRLVEQGVPRHVPVYFLCRSGARSKAAAIAATDAAYEAAYNVSNGFEGPVGPRGHRDVAGWKASGLPWRQK